MSIIKRPLPGEFLSLLELKDGGLIQLFHDLREYILELHPACNELLYHTHALSTVFCISDKLADSFCMINIYSKHLNLGFPKGTLLSDPHQLLTGTGNLIRHISVAAPADYRNKNVKTLLQAAIRFAIKDMDKVSAVEGKIISKMKSARR